ncbi:unnamed protein product [Caenorhabditis angaria]|uniref:Uncharacterized protein n=1 Tax=Caenorhabditis angaria TaxID=860376 RepID=A0A9P1IT07_9PELO|nr:unnamed protein product [Caenorhabditis angaria]
MMINSAPSSSEDDENKMEIAMEHLELGQQKNSTTTHLMNLPGELFAQVDQYLTLEESHHFKMADERIEFALHKNFHMYDKLFLSDDDSECRISDTTGRVPNRTFKGDNTPQIIKMLPNLKEITMIIKDVNLRRKRSKTPPNAISDCTPYSQGGYLTQLFKHISPAELKIRQLSVHVDIMIESLENVFLQCPTEDLKYAMDNLVAAQFSSFVQISICCAQIRASDDFARNFLLQGMQYALKQSAEVGAKTEFVVEPCEGYVDMTVEKGQLEYTFAFFYYNPTICDPTPEDAQPVVPLLTNYYF